MSRLKKLALALSVIGIAVVGLHTVPADAGTTSAHRSALVGELGIEGGAAPGGFHPTAGTVEVEFKSVPLVLDKARGQIRPLRYHTLAGLLHGHRLRSCGIGRDQWPVQQAEEHSPGVRRGGSHPARLGACALTGITFRAGSAEPAVHRSTPSKAW